MVVVTLQYAAFTSNDKNTGPFKVLVHVFITWLKKKQWRPVGKNITDHNNLSFTKYDYD